MKLEEMKRRKQELGYSLSDLARISGVPLGTVRKVFCGQTKSPRRGTIEKLEAVLRDESVYYARQEGSDSLVCEPAGSYDAQAQQPDNPYGSKMQGQYTVEDYLALPDDKRYELIDGVIYEMASPSSNHQVLAGYLYYRLMSCAEEHKTECYPYIAPLDVQLDKDNRTMVQPDVIICCDPALNIGPRLFGAPEFLAEVLSPSSRKRDIFIKLAKYKNAGVKEYWIIDPEHQKVIVYLFERDDEINLYTFDDEIPVAVSQGICQISFAQVKERLIR